MSKIRINDLARELEVKSRAILDVLVEVGVTEKKTHSSSVEEHEAEKVRAHFRAAAEAQAAPAKSARGGREADEIKTKIDLSHISKPGDVLKLITKQQQAATTPAPPAAPSGSAGRNQAGAAGGYTVRASSRCCASGRETRRAYSAGASVHYSANVSYGRLRRCRSHPRLRHLRRSRRPRQ